MLVVHALAVAATVAALLLGLWQYGVWQDGREDQASSRVNAPPVPLEQVMSSDAAFPRTGVGEPVSLSGRWVPRATIFVSDRLLRGRTGVWVVTPVAVCDGDAAGCGTAPAMLVVRGWAASVRAAPPAPTGPVRVTGWLQPGEGSAGPDPDPGDDVFPELRVADALQRVDQDLYGGYVIARSATSGSRGLAGLTPAALPEASTFTSVRNLLYALEWWFFGAFAVYVWGRWCRDEVNRVTGVPSDT
jgi:cytochrome oxidase assembly protein ShyY1